MGLFNRKRYMNLKEHSTREYLKFSSFEGSQHIASEFAIYKLIQIVKRFKSKSILEIGLGIGSISSTILDFFDDKIDYIGTEDNQFCLNSLTKNLSKEAYESLNVVDKLDKVFENKNIYDLIIAILMLSFIITESIADKQQFEFQSNKYKKINNNENLTGDFKRGFLSKGLWSFSRHPNFISEQLIWISFYLFSISATGTYLNWSIIGCILLIILFYNSANYTESISEKKYPDYKQYKKKVSMFFGFKKMNWEEN